MGETEAPKPSIKVGSIVQANEHCDHKGLMGLLGYVSKIEGEQISVSFYNCKVLNEFPDVFSQQLRVSQLNYIGETELQPN